MSKWEEVILSKDSGKISEVLLEIWLSPDRTAQLDAIDFSKLIKVKDWVHPNAFESLSVVEILLQSFRFQQDIEKFEMARELLRRGAALPTLHSAGQDISSASQRLAHLATDPHDLFISLYADPGIVTLRGKFGETILHRVAEQVSRMGSGPANFILYQLFTRLDIDFSVQDSWGNTPLHVAAYQCENRTTYRYVFPEFLRAAVERGFDFSVLNDQGEAVIHIAARGAYEHDTVCKFLEVVPNPGVNALSLSGSTALFEAIESGYFRVAESLLDAGADPTVFGDSDCDPMKKLEEQILFRKMFLGINAANKEGRLPEFVKKNKDYFVERYQKSHQIQPGIKELESFSWGFIATSSPEIDNIKSSLESLKAFKRKMSSIIKIKQGGRGVKCSFWNEVATVDPVPQKESVPDVHNLALSGAKG